MSRPTNRWKLGLFVLLGLGAAMITAAWLGARSLRREATTLHVFFDQEVTGLEAGAPLYFRGIQIGEVATIRAAPDRRHVEVLVDVFLDSLRALGFLAPEELQYGESEGTPPEDLRVQLVESLITGVATLQADFVDVEEFPVPEYPFPVPRNTLHPMPSTLNRLEQLLIESFARLPGLIDETSASLVDLRRTIEAVDAASLSQRAEHLLTTLDEELQQLYELPFLQQGAVSFEELTATLRETRAFVAELRAGDGSLQRLLDRYAELGGRLDQVLAESDVPGTFESLRSTSSTFGDAGAAVGALGREVQGDLETLRDTLVAARRLLELLERDPAALLRGR